MKHNQFLSTTALAAVSLCAVLIIFPGFSSPRSNAPSGASTAYDMISAHAQLHLAAADTVPAPPDSSNPATMDLTLKGDVTRGSDVFTKRCSDCHGDDAMGDKGPKLVGNNILTDDNAFWTTVLDGRKKMPVFKYKLTSQDIADVREFLKSLHPTE